MNHLAAKTMTAAATLAGLLGVSAPAHAVFVASICNDLACAGGDDFLVTDNGAGDTIGLVGAINFSVSAFGYSLVVNTSQSKPVVGSAAEPQLDLTFTATTTSAAAANVFLYASDTDFTAPGSFQLLLGGTNSGGSGTVTGRAWGGTSNTQLQFSSGNLLGTTGALSGATFGSSVTGAFAPAVNPYSLTIGVAVSRSSAGTTTGDLNLQVSAVPEPGSWALMLAGPALIGLMARRRRRQR